MKSESIHTALLTTKRLTGKRRHQINCDCGFVTPWYTNKATASRHHAMHRRQMTDTLTLAEAWRRAGKAFS